MSFVNSTRALWIALSWPCCLHAPTAAIEIRHSRQSGTCHVGSVGAQHAQQPTGCCSTTSRSLSYSSNPWHHHVFALCACVRHRRCDGSNALILPAKGAGSASAAGTGPAPAVQPQLSKSQLKKLKQVQMKKQRREQLSQVCVLPSL